MFATLVIPEELSNLYLNPTAAPVDTDPTSLQAHVLCLQQVIAVQEAIITLQNANIEVEVLTVRDEEMLWDEDDDV